MIRFPTSRTLRCALLLAAILMTGGRASALPIAAASTGGSPCGEAQRCPVAQGYYLAHAPRNWDGKSPLPTLVYFHGYSENAESVIADGGIRDFSDRNGILLIAPNGEGQTWSYPGSPGQYRNEFDFVRSVIRDVETRFPVERQRLWASGFSQGGSMVWYLACEMSAEFKAFAPISGAFWLPQPQECKSGPFNLLHIHGLNDDTVPMHGRAIGRRFRQGDVRDGLVILRTADGCRSEPDSRVSKSGMDCEIWNSCTSGKTLQICLHPGGHSMETKYLEQGWRWVNSLP